MVQGRRYQSLLRTYSGFPSRPVGRCECLIQLKKAHCDSAWPIAANAAIRSYLHPNEVGLSWAWHTWQLRWRKLHASCTADPPDACGWTSTRHWWHPPLVWRRPLGAGNRRRVLPTVDDLPGYSPLRGRSKILRSLCSCCSENIYTMRTTIQNDIQSKPYSLSRCSETASSSSTVWASKPLRISNNYLLQAAGDGAVEAARQADSPSKTSGKATGVIAAACAEGRES